MNPIHLLSGALKLLEDNGVAHGEFRDSRGRHCVMGALLTVLGTTYHDRDIRDSGYQQAVTALADLTPTAGELRKLLDDMDLQPWQKALMPNVFRYEYLIARHNDSHSPADVLTWVRQARDSLVAQAVQDGSAPLPYELPANTGRELVGAA